MLDIIIGVISYSTMNDNQIVALAREYAEETGKEFPTVLDIKQRNMENHLRWLCKRYCLVEKETIRKEFHEIKLALGDGGHSEWEDDINVEKEVLLKSLFPEIAKEVEE